MKKHILIILLFTSILNYSQEIRKDDFQNVIRTSFRVIDMLKESNLEKLKALLKLPTEEVKRLKSVENDSLKDQSTFTTPHFLLTDRQNVFQMVIVSFKTADKRPNESFNRGKYFIVIKSIVKLGVDNQAILFSDSKILTSSDQINTWWVSQYKSYITETTEVYKRFGYVPPPPCPPPLGL